MGIKILMRFKIKLILLGHYVVMLIVLAIKIIKVSAVLHIL